MRQPGRSALCLVLSCIGLVALVVAAHASVADEMPASPFAALRPRLLVPRFLDVGPSCVEAIVADDPELPTEILERLLTAHRAVRTTPPSGRPDLRAELEQLGRANEAPLIAACGRLEGARLALRMGFGPEAGAELRRAARMLPESDWPVLMRDLSRYLEAEALVVMQRGGEGVDRLREATASSDSDLALAAQLRLFELATRDALTRASQTSDAAPTIAPVDEPEADTAYAVWKRLAALLGDARARNFDLSSWTARAGEHALAANRLTEAHQWLAAAEGVTALRRISAIRKADVLMRLDRPDDARRTLRRVVANARDAAVRDLSRVRLASYRLVTEGAEERTRLLERASRSDHPIVSSIARDQLALEYVESRALDAALSALRQLAFVAPTLHHAPRFSTTLDRALLAVAEEGECDVVLGRLAHPWDLFLRYATRPGPFARVGDCFIEVGMFSEALRVYRALARTLGVESVPHLAWRVARASLAAGDLPSARASIRASLRPLVRVSSRSDSAKPSDSRTVEIPDANAARWWWLAGELAEREGRDADALASDPALLASEHLPQSLRPATEARVARLIARLPGQAARLDPILASSLDYVVDTDLEDRAVAQTEIADRLWEAGDRVAAADGYRSVESSLDVPTPRSRARYRAALQAAPDDATRQRLREAVADDPFNAWSRLARVELRMMSVRESVGLDAMAGPR